MDSRGWDRRWEERALGGYAEPAEVLVVELEGLAAGRALDLACGPGRNAVWLAERGWQVTAIDFSPVALEQARELAASRGVEVEWLLADLQTYEPPQSAFDLVLVLYLHLAARERRPLLARAVAALAPGGTLLVVGHHLANLGTGAPGPSDPDLLYTPDEIAAELPGLAIERADGVMRAVESNEGPVEAIDALVRAVAVPGRVEGSPTQETSGLLANPAH